MVMLSIVYLSMWSYYEIAKVSYKAKAWSHTFVEIDNEIISPPFC